MMSLATLELIAGVVQLLMSTASQLPAVIAAGHTVVALLQSNSDPTPEQEATIVKAQHEAHLLLQAS